MDRPPHDDVAAIQAAWGRERPDVDVSSLGLVVPVLRLAALISENRSQALTALQLDPSHLDVLETLRRAGPPYRLPAGELSRRCRVTPGATSQRVAAMERLGLVERVREDPDRRTVHVELTETGRQRVDDVFAEVMSADEQLLDGLDDADRRTLETLLRRWLSLAVAAPRRVARGSRVDGA